MKPAPDIAQEWTNKHVVNVRGHEFTEFVKFVQDDARKELLEKIESLELQHSELSPWNM